ncbi:hypothetical protein Cyrtocomes_00633 [Candidatus Cyrtobacter comes]|uniref:Uncharacterized protein n=1 Tax=Candidatus Cyrtobacter comes TaxID=675776 RepID=A0ABU5L810_9RICK|nr:hypothetical protein [Candidatus Cyrtobacter comes]
MGRYLEWKMTPSIIDWIRDYTKIIHNNVNNITKNLKDVQILKIVCQKN